MLRWLAKLVSKSGLSILYHGTMLGVNLIPYGLVYVYLYGDKLPDLSFMMTGSARIGFWLGVLTGKMW